MYAGMHAGTHTHTHTLPSHLWRGPRLTISVTLKDALIGVFVCVNRRDIPAFSCILPLEFHLLF